VPLDGLLGLIGEHGNLRHGQPSEEAELEDSRLVRMQPGQPRQVVVQDQMIDGVVARSFELVESYLGAAQGAAIPARGATPGAVHENAPHGFGGGGNEMIIVAPRLLSELTEPEPDFVDQGGGLESVAGAFARHAGRRDAAELRVKALKQLLRGA
jgi:hypothetical protein